MKEINYSKTNRRNIYNWFKTFSNATYGCNSQLNVTNLVNHCQQKNESFFINMLYIVVKGLNSVEETRIRLIDNKVILFDKIKPSYTVLSNYGFYDNVKQEYYDSYNKFYEITKSNIEVIKNSKKVKDSEYNNSNYDYYYITCLPWLNITSVSHPIPDDKSSQSVPRICWGKYSKENDQYFLTLNITVNHMFVDGHPLSQVFNNIQKLLDETKDILK